MNCPPYRTNAFGTCADSVESGSPATGVSTGSVPGWPSDAGRVGLVGGDIYRLTETNPTA